MRCFRFAVPFVFIFAALAVTPAGAVTQNTVNFIAHFEGFYRCVKPDPAGYPTVGYGHRVYPAEQKRRRKTGTTCITVSDGKKLLRKDLRKSAKEIKARLKGVRVTGTIMTALTSYTFNLGPGYLDRIHSKWTGTSDVAANLKRRKYLRGAKEMRRYDGVVQNGRRYTLPGLTRRRKAEFRKMKAGIATLKKCKLRCGSVIK